MASASKPDQPITITAVTSGEAAGMAPKDASSGPEAATAVLQNPLLQMSNEEIMADTDRFVQQYDMPEHRDVFRKGGLLAKVYNQPNGFERLDELTEADKEAMRYETEHRWRSSPAKLYMLCALCASCAIVQGMDQTVINGAQDFYFSEFKITDKVLQGLINGSPYASAALIGCWLNAPLNKHWGRRGTIALSCFVAFATAIWQAFANRWEVLIAGRFVLGLAVGAKSSTTPVYAAECAPKTIRGALTMMWQMWTAFGIMLGFAVSLIFQDVDFLGPYSQWRWMIGVTALPPLIVGALVYCMPESPRWYMDKGRFADAFKSLRTLRQNDLQAARDMYLAYKLLDDKQGSKGGWTIFKEFFTVRRNRRAAQSAWFCMFMQQFCGVNVLAYYSTKIFTDAGYSHRSALLVSFGCGVCNFLGAIPAVFTIDRFGRRDLLLFTFPLMSICLFWTGLSFQAEDTNVRLGLIATSLYAFMIIYSPGLGPVPFTYSAEAFPLHIRAIGMSSATSITWAFNFLISFTWPKMMEKMTATGGFFWYATWNLIGWTFAYFLVPETKNMTLEELDGVFSVRNRDHARYYVQKLNYRMNKMLGRDVEPMPPLYQMETESNVQITEPKPQQV